MAVQFSAGTNLSYTFPASTVSVSGGLTVAGWAATNTGDSSSMWCNLLWGTPDQNDLQIIVSGADWRIWLASQGDDRRQTLSSSIPDGSWHHVAASITSTTISSYLDGVLIGTLTGFPALTGFLTKLYVNVGETPYTSYSANERAQDYCVYTRALSDAEIALLYRRRVPVPNGLLGWYPMLGGGSFAKDYSGNGRDLTVTGSVVDATVSPPSTAWGGTPLLVRRSVSTPITVGTKYLRLISGAQAEAVSVVTSGGAGSASEIPALNASGILDASFIPRVSTSAGAADAGKVVALNASGILDASIVNSTVTSSGAGSAGKVVALDSSGLIDTSAFAVTAPTITATAAAALSAGNLVYIDSATGQVRPADNSLGRKTSGFVLSAYGAGATATVRTAGRLTGLSGLTPGSPYYLATAGGITDTAPTTTGLTWQYVGVAVSATELNFTPSFSVLL